VGRLLLGHADTPKTRLRQRLHETGIGFAGIDGAWWRPAAEPFCLPAAVTRDLEAIGDAIFLLLDVLDLLYQTDTAVFRLLTYKVPRRIPRLVSRRPVLLLRPDFQLVAEPDGRLRLVATELEIAPSAHGFAHAMQVGYGLEPDLVNSFRRYLNGRPLLFAGTHHWNAFIFEQLAFCRALSAAGGRGYVLYDQTITEMAAAVQSGRQWQLPMFGVPAAPDGWNVDMLGRIRAHGLAPYLWPETAVWPANVGDAVVFRFGYFDNLTPSHLARLGQWQRQGATLLNPASFFLESKAVMAALNLPVVRQAIARRDPAALATLDRCLPPTHLLDAATAVMVAGDKNNWVLKYAGFDGGHGSWGGASLHVGLHHSSASWQTVIDHYLRLPWPVVAQRVTPSLVTDVAYLDEADQIRVLVNGRSRLRVFFLRQPGGAAVPCGAHVTFSGGQVQVSESVSAVQAPLLFKD
jgi:hypothetical protein